MVLIGTELGQTGLELHGRGRAWELRARAAAAARSGWGAITEEVVEVLLQRRQQVSIESRWEQEHKSTETIESTTSGAVCRWDEEEREKGRRRRRKLSHL